MAPTELQGLIDEAIESAMEEVAKTVATSVNASLRSAFYAAVTPRMFANHVDGAWADFLTYLEDPNG